MNQEQNPSRRDFLKLAAAGAIVAGSAPIIFRSLGGSTAAEAASPADEVRFATIGTGGMGFGDTRAALRVPGTRLVAAADCYDGRLKRVKEVFGKQVDTTRRYEDILERSDVDAVIITTPDHWHARIAIDAMNAGKHVYCEKPMVQDLEEGPKVIAARQRTGRVVQVGSQGISSVIDHKARDLYRAGAIGRLTMVEAVINRNSAIGAWQYSIPPDASPKTIDWERFQGNAPGRSFDADRFFRWRKYWDYGTGIPGDLFVHLHTAIHFVLGSHGPDRVMSSGGIRYWTEKREVPDVMAGLYNYPETDNHPGFTLSLKVNFADGSQDQGTGFRFVGDEGMLVMGGDELTLSKAEPRGAPGYTIGTFADSIQQDFLKEYHQQYPEPEDPKISESGETVYRAPGDYSARVEHFRDFFHAIRTGEPVIEDADVGFRAAAPAILANISYRENRICRWDPEAMRMG